MITNKQMMAFLLLAKPNSAQKGLKTAHNINPGNTQTIYFMKYGQFLWQTTMG